MELFRQGMQGLFGETPFIFVSKLSPKVDVLPWATESDLGGDDRVFGVALESKQKATPATQTPSWQREDWRLEIEERRTGSQNRS